MTFKKFGTGDIVKDEKDNQGLSKEASQKVEWTRQDEEDLKAEQASE